MSALTRILEPNNLRPFFSALWLAADVRSAIREDAQFVRLARQALFPLPWDRDPDLNPEPFPEPQPLKTPLLDHQRVAVVASGGSGATAAVVGVQRAFEEADLQPIALAASSGSVLFCAPWACGLKAADIAEFWLTRSLKDYLDPNWWKLAKSAGRALTGWAGLVQGEAVERTARELVGDRKLGDTRVPFSMVVWNVDLNQVELLGTRATPELPVATAMRIAISIPIFVEPVRIGSHIYGDGGVVDIFPVSPVLAEQPDLIVGVNSYLPHDFAGEDITGWQDRTFSIIRASGQLRWSGMVALAREQVRQAGDKLVLLHPVPYEEVRGAKFYESFVDRRSWPNYMRAGRLSARDALMTVGTPRPGHPHAAAA